MDHDRDAYRIIMLGNKYVGKTSFISQYIHKAFYKNSSLKGADFFCNITKHSGQNLNLQIWDQKNLSRFGPPSPWYYKDSRGILLFYSCNDRNSFVSLNFHFERLNLYAEVNTIVILVGNKCDKKKKVVSFDEAHELAKKFNVLFVENSAKTGENVDLVFSLLVSSVY